MIPQVLSNKPENKETLLNIICHAPLHINAHHLTHQNLVFALPATPKHLSRHPRHAKILFLPSPPGYYTLLHCTVLSLNFPPFFCQTLADRADSGDKRQDIRSDHTLKVSARSGQGARTSSISNRRTDGRTDGMRDPLMRVPE